MGRLRRGGEFTGLLVSPFLGRRPTRRERQLGEWADKRGLFVAVRADAEEHEVWHELGVEELVEGKIVAYWMSLPQPEKVWPEMLDHYEKLLRAGFERYKEDKARFPWWEHVS